MADDGKVFWERTAARYDLSMRILGGPLGSMLPLVAEEVAGLEQVLEVAAGTGLVTRAVAPVVSELLATDYAEAMVAQLKQRVAELGLENVQTRTLDVYALDATERFDGVVAANVLHLVPDLDEAVAAMARVLRPGGRLVVPTYCHAQTFSARMTSAVMSLGGFPGRRRFTLDSLQEALVRGGLEVRRSTLLPGLLPIGFVSGQRVVDT